MTATALEVAREALAGERAFVVGGAVRDRLLGRPVTDLDLVLEGDVRAAARRLGRAAGGPSFALSDAFGAWRALAGDGSWQADLTPRRGASIEEDLAARDVTVNAMAEPLAGGDLVDPHGGRADLAARRLRAVGPRAFVDDPLRVMRIARLACELGLVPEDQTVALARRQAAKVAGVAPERVFAELKRIVGADAALEGLRQLDALDATRVVLPELEALKGVEQNAYHDRDAHGHTLLVLDRAIALGRDPAAILGAEHAEGVRAVLAEPLADDLTRGTALRFGALLHDGAKPATRTVRSDGQAGFPGHDTLGAQVSRDALARLHASERLRAHVAALALHHLRLGFLVHRQPIDRYDVFSYLTACEPVEVDVTLLSVVDRLATLGRKAQESIERHLALARPLLGDALRWRRAGGRPAPLVRGDELARALDLRPGPEVGRLLAALSEAQYAGEVSDAPEALRFARRAHAASPR